MQVNVVTVFANTAPFTNFHRHTARNHIARSEVFISWRITFHEAFAFGVCQIAAFTARTFRNQTTRTINTGWVELNELHILQWQASTSDHAVAIARTSMS